MMMPTSFHEKKLRHTSLLSINTADRHFSAMTARAVIAREGGGGGREKGKGMERVGRKGRREGVERGRAGGGGARQ